MYTWGRGNALLFVSIHSKPMSNRDASVGQPPVTLKFPSQSLLSTYALEDSHC